MKLETDAEFRAVDDFLALLHARSIMKNRDRLKLTREIAARSVQEQAELLEYLDVFLLEV